MEAISLRKKAGNLLALNIQLRGGVQLESLFQASTKEEIGV